MLLKLGQTPFQRIKMKHVTHVPMEQLWGLLIPPPYSLEVQQGGNSGTGNPRTP